LHGKLPWAAGWVNVTNDLIWLVPFIVILLRVYQANRTTSSKPDDAARVKG
jgi:hypothetical protein